MDGNQNCHCDNTSKEEMIDNVLFECKTEHKFPDRMDGLCEDLLKNDFVIKKEYLDDFIDEHVKEEPMDGSQTHLEVKLESGDYAANTKSEPDNGKMSDDGGEYDHRKRPFFCHDCSFTTHTKYLASQHMKRHMSGNPDASADHIENRSSQKQNLRSRLMTHSGENPYSCNVCNYRTIDKANLDRHKLRHLGEKPLSCNVCDYRTTRKDSLKRHLSLIHSGEKPLSCGACDYKTVRKDNLKNHMLTHTGERPFSCNVCDYTANHRSNLKCHMVIHSGEKPYSCNVCYYRTTRNDALKRHLLLIHSGEKRDS